MKFTTYVPTTGNDGIAFDESWLKRVIYRYWRPFRGVTNEGMVEGHWFRKGDDEREYVDLSHKISIECDRERLQEAIRAVTRLGRKLKQVEMYFEVSGYDGVQFVVM